MLLLQKLVNKMEDIKKIIDDIKQEEAKDEDLFDFSFVETDGESEEQNKKEQEEKPTIQTEDELQNYINEQLKNKEVLALKKRTEEHEWIKNNYPSFEKIMDLKRIYKNITIVEMGDSLEQTLFALEPKLYIIRAMPQSVYQQFLANTGTIAENIIAFTSYSILECVIYPELDEEDVEQIPVGVGDILTNEINKFSRFASTKKITRI